MKFVCSTVFLFVLSCSAFADLKVSNRTTAGGQTFTTTVLIKPGKIRGETAFAPGFSIVTIQDCASHQLIQVNDRARSFMSPDTSGDTQTPGDTGVGGNQVTVTADQQDTGEHKILFGYNARRMKGTITAVGSGSCSTNLHATTDGWYIDVPEAQSCAPSYNQLLRTGMQNGCDGVILKPSGVEKPGFPLVLDTTVETNNGPMTIHQETTDVSKAALDPVRFEVPAGYTKVNSYQALMGFGAPQKQNTTQDAPGSTLASGTQAAGAVVPTTVPPAQKRTLRIGVAQVSNLTGGSLQTDTWQQELVNDIDFLGAKAVVLAAAPTDREGTLAEAQDRGCDYVVFTDVIDFKSVGVGEKIGNVLNRGGIGGVGGTGQGRVEISAVVRVFQPNNVVPVLDRSEDFRQNDAGATTRGLLHTEARDVMLALQKLQSAK